MLHLKTAANFWDRAWQFPHFHPHQVFWILGLWWQELWMFALVAHQDSFDLLSLAQFAMLWHSRNRFPPEQGPMFLPSFPLLQLALCHGRHSCSHLLVDVFVRRFVVAFDVPFHRVSTVHAPHASGPQSLCLGQTFCGKTLHTKDNGSIRRHFPIHFWLCPFCCFGRSCWMSTIEDDYKHPPRTR